MPSFLETLLALNGLNVPPVPNAAPSLLPAGLPNVPLAPTPAPPINIGPPPAMPGGAPAAPAPPLDLSLINQYQALRGPAPTPPVVQQPGFLDKLSTALLGVSAGLQGRGGEFAQSVREERQRPQREYQRQLQAYNQQGTELGVQGLNAAERKQERQQ